MEVLLIGANRADLDAVDVELIAAGHRTHRCAPGPGDPGAATGVRCVGELDERACPLTDPIDVALVVDSGDTTPGMEPIGRGCALRDHVPTATLTREDDPIAALDSALAARDERWSAALRALTAREDVACTAERDGLTLHVTVTGDVDPDDRITAARLSSRAYDVVRRRVPRGIRSIGVGMHRSADTSMATPAPAGAGSLR